MPWYTSYSSWGIWLHIFILFESNRIDYTFINIEFRISIEKKLSHRIFWCSKEIRKITLHKLFIPKSFFVSFYWVFELNLKHRVSRWKKIKIREVKKIPRRGKKYHGSPSWRFRYFYPLHWTSLGSKLLIRVSSTNPTRN